jgi:hypothetical protein
MLFEGPRTGHKKELTEAEVWRLCIDQEPRLEELRKAASWFGRGSCALALWAALVKPRLESLVGWDRQPRSSQEPSELLTSTRAYDTCYAKIAAALPECTHRGECHLSESKRRRSTLGQIRSGRRLPLDTRSTLSTRAPTMKKR